MATTRRLSARPSPAIGPRAPIRDVGKALGLPEDLIKTLSSGIWSWSETVGERQVRELGLNPDDRRLTLTLKLAQQLMGAPRHLGQHPGGFVLTHDRLDDLVPIEPATMADRQVIEWDKDDIEALKFMKGRRACARHADLHGQGIRADQRAQA